ncbi:MAG: phosphoenolpyruvate--protein phosphotransferase [Burkholderiales bacterium]
MTIQLFGLPVSRGIAIGKAVLVASSRLDIAHYFVDAVAVETEIARLRRARDEIVQELLALQAELPGDAPAELSALMDVHLMILGDDAIISDSARWITDRHYNAEWALAAQLEVLARQFDEMEDEYLRERKADLEQVVERLMRVLSENAIGLQLKPIRSGDGKEEPLILVANDIAPADMLQFKRSVFTGFVTDLGGKTSHTAIVARSLDIPAVVGTREASRLIRQDDWLIIDGEAGAIIINPSPIILEEYRFKQLQSHLEGHRLSRLRHTPAITLDGERVHLLANIELPSDAEAALDAGCVGIGLFRSEFLFLNRNGDLPDENEQFEAYRAAIEAMQGLPVTIRTVDIGADKSIDRLSLSELRHESTLNPALGLRAIRWSLSEPAMFRQQIRAILRASAYGSVKILIPMVAHWSEVEQIFDAITNSKQQLRDAGKPFQDIPVGAMIEVPAAALRSRELLTAFDFLSIGTNDLIQYTLAIDRSDESVAHLYNPWHPAVLGLIYQTIRNANLVGKEVSVCGEIAGDPQFTQILLAMGLRVFSMHPSQVSRVKQEVLRSKNTTSPEFLEAILSSTHVERAWQARSI